MADVRQDGARQKEGGARGDGGRNGIDGIQWPHGLAAAFKPLAAMIHRLFHTLVDLLFVFWVCDARTMFWVNAIACQRDRMIDTLALD